MRRKPEERNSQPMSTRRIVAGNWFRDHQKIQGITYSNGDVDVLSKDNTLGLDDEEVDELLSIVGHALKRCLGDGKVLAWPELRGETTSESQLSNNLCCSGGTKCQVRGLEDVANQVEVSGGEDEDEGGGKCDTGCARILPAQEAVEQAVVVCLLLVMTSDHGYDATYGSGSGRWLPCGRALSASLPGRRTHRGSLHPRP